MTTKDFSVSCIIPMHNEEANAARIISEAEKIFSQLVTNWEIIVIESGSIDHTWERLNEAIKGKERMRVFRQEKKEGMGSALRLGYSKCTKDLICHLEADSPFELAYFKKALPILLENDFVIGYRISGPEQNFKWSYYNMGSMALLRSLYHVGYNLLLRLVFGLVVRDANFSFKIFKRKDIEKLNLVSNGWFIDAEILLELKKHGLLPIELPVVYSDRTGGQSTVDLLHTPFNMLKEMFGYMKIRSRRDKEARCQR